MLASILMAMVGVGYLFPFSALTQPVDYWNTLFPDFNIEFSMTTVYMYTNLTALALIVFCGGEPSFTPRIVGGFIGQLTVLVLVPTSYFFITDEHTNFLVIMASTVVVAVATAFLDSAVLAFSSQYPTRIQEALQFGIGLSTLLSSVYRDLTKAAFAVDSVVTSSLVYFYSGAAVVMCCIVCYFWLLRLPISQKFLSRHRDSQSKAGKAGKADERTPLVPGPGREGGAGEGQEATVTHLTVIRKVWFNLVLVSLLFVSSLALWPALLTEIKSYQFPYMNETKWWPLVLLTLFSLMDCVGRILVRYRGPITRQNVWIPVFLRFLFLPLVACSVQGIFFTHDLWSIAFSGGLGFTNGYIGSMVVIFVNEAVDPHERAMAGMMTSFFILIGLVGGASAGLLMEHLVVGARDTSASTTSAVALYMMTRAAVTARR